MSRRFLRERGLRLLVLLWLAVPCLAWSAEPPSSSPDAAAIAGRELERQRNWRDAIDHYEQALQTWPENPDLVYGLRRAKFQYSIDRRYSDESFRTTLLSLPRSQALDLLDNVLAKVQTRFVEPISIQSTVAHGTESLWLALANPKFLDQNIAAADPAQVQQLRDLLRQNYWNRPVAGRSEARRVVDEICESAQRRIGLASGAIVMEYVFGACNCLDDYSNVLTPARYADLYTNIDGEFVGIGIVMEGKLGNGMELIDVLPDSPALEAGLFPGEWIVSVDGVDCHFLSTEEAATLLTGTSGSVVELEIVNDSGARRTVTCRRRAVKVKSIPVATIIDRDCGVAYIRMAAFQKHTADELDQALAALSRDGMRSLVWDLRSNPGGLLDEAVAVLDRFIEKGTLVSTRGRLADDSQTYEAFAPGTWQMPLVLLIDGNSASASEIVAGAIRDHRRGTLVGRTSYGKWSVQTIVPLSNGMGLRLTTARFYSPSGATFSKIGVRPDVAVELPDARQRRRATSPVDVAGDPDLRAALDILCRQSVTSR